MFFTALVRNFRTVPISSSFMPLTSRMLKSRKSFITVVLLFQIQKWMLAEDEEAISVVKSTPPEVSSHFEPPPRACAVTCARSKLELAHEAEMEAAELKLHVEWEEALSRWVV